MNLLKHMRDWHEIHYLALQNQDEPEGFGRSGEYSSHSYAVPHSAPARMSPGSLMQAAVGVFSPLPLAVSRYRVAALKRKAAELMERSDFDRVVVDFLATAPNAPHIESSILFQHNVETVIWDRQAESAANPVLRLFFRNQANKMRAYEREICSRAGHVIAVSKEDAQRMEGLFGAHGVSSIATAVDIGYFARPGNVKPWADLCFLGSMDWMPNIDGVLYFANEILPLIRRVKPDCTFGIVGRRPSKAIEELAARDRGIFVTGTVDDVRPYLFGSSVSVVPLRAGGGTRLKIYEAMAAKAPVVSTTVGAEGLEFADGESIAIADTPQDFAARCLHLLDDAAARARMAQMAWDMVAARFSSEAVAREFSTLVERAPKALRG